jgi:hypothetical protein
MLFFNSKTGFQQPLIFDQFLNLDTFYPYGSGFWDEIGYFVSGLLEQGIVMHCLDDFKIKIINSEFNVL